MADDPNDQAEKGMRAGAIVTIIVSFVLVVVQIYLLAAALVAKPPNPLIVLGRSLFFAPLIVALLVGLPAIKTLKEKP